MDRDAVLDLLSNRIDELKSMGIHSLALFGSVARGEADPDSDIDFLIELEPPLTFDRYITIKFYLEELFDRPVDLVMPQALKPRVRFSAEQEAIIVA